MTRILVETVACPQCAHVQKARIVYSWNEFKSGPLPPNAHLTVCAACGHAFDAYDARVGEADPDG